MSLETDKAAESCGWLTHFAGLDMPASSEWTRKTLDWEPTGPGLIEDLMNMNYQSPSLLLQLEHLYRDTKGPVRWALADSG